MTVDIDYLAEYTDALPESEGLEDPIELVNKEIAAVGRRRGRGIHG